MRVDHQAETRKLQNIMTSVTVQMAANDLSYGAAWASAPLSGVGRASRRTARSRSAPYLGVGKLMYLACTSRGPRVYLGGDPGVTALRAEALARC